MNKDFNDCVGLYENYSFLLTVLKWQKTKTMLVTKVYLE